MESNEVKTVHNNSKRGVLLALRFTAAGESELISDHLMLNHSSRLITAEMLKECSFLAISGTKYSQAGGG